MYLNDKDANKSSCLFLQATMQSVHKRLGFHNRKMEKKLKKVK